MKNYILILLVLCTSCTIESNSGQEKKTHPSHKLNYTEIDRSKLMYLEKDYVPVYSDIYHVDGSRRFNLSATVSIRNTSLSDTAYVLTAKYFDSYGNELKNYLKAPVVLSPLESIEFVVEESEKSGGAGANFIIDWGAKKYSNQVLIQSVMIGTYGQQGISFLSESKKIDYFFKE